MLLLALTPMVQAKIYIINTPQLMSANSNASGVTYNNGTGLLLNSNTFSIDSSVCTVSNGLCSSSGDNTSWNEALANSLYSPISEPIASSLGNWSNDKLGLNNGSSNLTIAQVTLANGNWSLDKSSYATLSQLNDAVGQNLTYALITTANGNWSNDKISYYTITQVNTLGNFSATRNILLNTTGFNTGNLTSGTIPLTRGGTGTTTGTGSGSVVLNNSARMVNLTMGAGYIKLGNNTGFTCNITNAGWIMYNYNLNKMQLCNSTSWTNVTVTA